MPLSALPLRSLRLCGFGVDAVVPPPQRRRGNAEEAQSFFVLVRAWIVVAST